MVARLVLAAVLLVAALGVAWVLQRRRPAPPPRDVYPVPRQLDRADFPRREAPWLVALFSSTTCEGCAGLADKVAVLESREVAVCDIDFETERELHRRYEISGIPMTLVADAAGVVRAAFVGSVTATDLWAAVAECRHPGTSPEPELGEL
ncbi:MAG TPA: thioredoxin family protein [Acidimicrobiia bacterium]|nr:thioredoxin family protein [Acidimicrobiia bacterium]